MPTDDSDDFREADPRCVWPNEARDFTPWLAANINRLTKVLPFDLASIQIETEVNGGYVDITATVADSDTRVIIENQLEVSDDDHLVRIQTYAAARDAQIIIWVAKDFSQQHQQIINWMNNNTRSDVAFYGFRIRAFKKGKSKPYPFFDLVIQPTKPVRTSNQNIARSNNRYKAFFQGIVDELSKQNLFEYEPVRSEQSWFEFNTGLDGVTYVAAFTPRSTARAKLHIRCRIESNHQVFEYLSDRKQEIEDKFGEPLNWEERSQGKHQRYLIGVYKPGSIDDAEKEMSDLNAWMVEKLAKLKQVFDPYLDDATTRQNDP